LTIRQGAIAALLYDRPDDFAKTSSDTRSTPLEGGAAAEKRVDANYGERSGGVSLAQILLIADRARSPDSPVA